MSIHVPRNGMAEPVFEKLSLSTTKKPLRQAFQQVKPEIDHWVIQAWGVPSDRINDAGKMTTTCCGLVKDLKLTRVSDHSHYFGPGVSTVIILSESHLSIHTWPEIQYLHLDLVTCVKILTREQVEKVITHRFAPQHIELVQLSY